MRLVHRHPWLALLLGLVVIAPVRADDALDKVDEERQRGATVGAILPIYSQLVRFALPDGLRGGFEKDYGANYIFEWVPKGESVQSWTRLLTVSGARGAARNEELTPKLLLERLSVLAYQRACPSTFAYLELGSRRVSDQDAFAAVIACGNSGGAAPHSEIAVILAIKGAADYYTIQRAERGAAIEERPALDAAGWAAKLDALSPIYICARVAGEAPPFPSCVNRK